MFNENQLRWMAERVGSRIDEINTLFLRKIGERIKAIGAITPTDAHKLAQMLDYGSDIREIASALSIASARNISDINDIFETVAKDNYAFSEKIMKARGVWTPFEDNIRLQELIRSFSRSTIENYLGLTQTGAFCVYDLSEKRIPTALSEVYQKVVEKAVVAVSTGEGDYSSQMRETLKSLSDSGLRTLYTEDRAGRTVEYASGYSRRLDTAVRQNLLWGIKQANLGYQEQLGQQFGADGYEIDYHAHPRPSHAQMGGRQYAIGKARTVNGVYYPSFEKEAEPLLNDYGCLHFKYPIVLGISEPSYSKDQLAQFKANDNRVIEYDGKKYTPYEASQIQRQLETAIRHQKDRTVISAAADDRPMREEAQARINALTREYKRFSSAAGLPPKAERMTISGYHPIKIKTNK